MINIDAVVPRDAPAPVFIALLASQADCLASGYPSDWKTMKSIGADVREIRIHCADGAYRVIYAVKIADAVYSDSSIEVPSSPNAFIGDP